MTSTTKTQWEYGFYDSDPDGVHVYDRDWVPEPQSNPTIWWYTFGGLVGFETPEMAEHTASKSTWGQPIIVRRRKGSTEWTLV